MRIIPSCASLLFALAVNLPAQTTPTAIPDQPATTANQPVAQSASNPVFTLKASTKRVLVDVIVKDKKGAPIHGLKASDVEIEENGQPQQVHDFEEHSAITTAAAVAAPKFPKLPPGEFTNFTPVPQTGSLNIVLVDRLNTTQVDQVYLLQQLTDYLKHGRPDSRTAIYGLTDHLIVLQGFTSNPEVLLKAIERNTDTKASPLKDDNFGHAGKDDLTTTIDMVDRNSGSTVAIADFEGQYQQFQSQISSKLTLDALNEISRAMITLPGRKNLIWFTGTFPSGLFPGDTASEFADLEDEFRETINLMTSAQIAIYPIDAQGLRTLEDNNAAYANPRYARGNTGGLVARADIDNESNGIATEHLAMEQIARDTGGEAFYNSNDLVKGVDNALASGSNFYSIAYIPTNKEARPLYRSISVKIAGQKYNLSYRRGYYMDVRESQPGRTPLKLAGAAAAPPRPTSLRTALLQSGPEPTEILLRVRATPVTHGGDQTVAAGNQANPDTTKSHGPYQEFAVSFATSARALSFKHGADGRYRSDIDFVTYVYDSKGILVNAQSNTMRASYSQQQVADILRTGIPFVQRISVPQNGAYYLRLAVHDNVSDKVGALEIPVSSLRDLPLLAESQPNPAQPTP